MHARTHTHVRTHTLTVSLSLFLSHTLLAATLSRSAGASCCRPDGCCWVCSSGRSAWLARADAAVAVAAAALPYSPLPRRPSRSPEWDRVCATVGVEETAAVGPWHLHEGCRRRCRRPRYNCWCYCCQCRRLVPDQDPVCCKGDPPALVPAAVPPPRYVAADDDDDDRAPLPPPRPLPRPPPRPQPQPQPPPPLVARPTPPCSYSSWSWPGARGCPGCSRSGSVWPPPPPRNWSSSRTRSPYTCSSAGRVWPWPTGRRRTVRTAARARSPRSRVRGCTRRCTSRRRSSCYRAASSSREGHPPEDCTWNTVAGPVIKRTSSPCSGWQWRPRRRRVAERTMLKRGCNAGYGKRQFARLSFQWHLIGLSETIIRIRIPWLMAYNNFCNFCNTTFSVFLFFFFTIVKTFEQCAL